MNKYDCIITCVGPAGCILASRLTEGADAKVLRGEAGCEGWSYRDVLPYFKRGKGNERFHDDYHGSEGSAFTG